jgi:hypothetical protein
MFAAIVFSTISAAVAVLGIALWSDALAFLREDTAAH